jgi:hypothetical protein
MALANFTKSCAKNVPGESTLWLVESTSIASVTITTGEVTGLTFSGGGTFKTIAIDQDSLERMEEGKGTKSGNIGYKHTIKFTVSLLGTALNVLREALEAASVCGLTCLIKDNNGTWWLVGYNASTTSSTAITDRPLKLITNNSKSGLTPNDENSAMAEIVLEAENGYMALPVKSSATVAVGGIS